MGSELPWIYTAPYSGTGGFQRYARQLTNYLPLKTDIGIISHTPTHASSKQRISPMSHRFSFSSIVNYYHLAISSWAEKYSLLHFPSQYYAFSLPPFGYSPPVDLAKADNIIMTMHDMEFLTSEISRLDKTAEYIRRDIESIDQIVAISEYSAESIKEYYPVTEEDITIIHNCVDISTFNPQNQQYDTSILDNLGINKPYMFHISDGQPRKNIGLILDSIEMVEIDMTYVFAGGAAEKVRKELVDRDLDKEQFILISKRLNDLELAAIYRSALSLLYPSEAEGFGYPIAECMACGTNCIVSKKGAIPEVAGQNANYIRNTTAECLAEKIKQVYVQGGERSNTELASRIQKRFNVYRFAKEYSSLYSKYIDIEIEMN